MEPVLIALVLGLAFLWFLLRWRHSDKGRKQPPQLNILEAVVEFHKDPAKFIQESHKRFGNIFTANFGVLKIHFIFGSQAIQRFFAAKETELTIAAAQRFVQAITGPPRGRLLPHTYKYIANGFLRQERLQMYIDWCTEEAQKRFKYWASQDTIDVFKEASRLVMYCNIRCFLGQEMYEKYADEIATLYYDVENNAFSPLLLIAPWLPTPTNLKVKRSRQRLLQLISDHVQQRLQNPEKYVSKCQDWLQVCIQWGIEDGVDPMRLALSLGNVIVSAMFAAHTNTGGTMGWTLAHLAQDKELQESVRQEVLHFVEKENVTALSPAIINKLSLLDSCMKETQRRYPLLFLFRQTVEPQEFEGYYIPAGEYVCISPLITHMSSELWENPTQYRPQRFLNEEMIQKQIDNKTYIQFGFGLHRCLGEKFANVVLKTCWFNLLKDYALEPKSEMSPPNYKRAVGMPFSTHPIFIAVKKREHQLNDFPSPQQQQNQ